ncbi:MAG TPA: hypothetical protein PK413_16490 [Thermoanaerobaculia bacterium]|nr:hypothetical protein [Thermoanaerobaculia bacterium]
MSHSKLAHRCTLLAALLLVLPIVFASAPLRAAEPVAPEGVATTSSLDQLLPPAPAERAGCHCFAHGTTPSDVPLSWGMAADCATATAQLDANTQELADEICLNDGTEGVCAVGALQITTACWNNMGTIQVDGKRTFKCLVCIDPLPKAPVNN